MRVRDFTCFHTLGARTLPPSTIDLWEDWGSQGHDKEQSNSPYFKQSIQLVNLKARVLSAPKHLVCRASPERHSSVQLSRA